MQPRPEAPVRSPTRGGKDCLTLAALLGIALMLFSFSRILGDLNSAAGHVRVLESAIAGPVWRTRLGLNMALFAVALLALHLSFAMLCWGLAALSERSFGRVARSRWLLTWFLGATLWLLMANATFYPRSSLGEPYQELLRESAAGRAAFVIVSCLLAGAVILTLISAARRLQAARRIAFATCAAGALLAAAAFTDASPDAALRPEPNIIILGVDSLRTDAVTPQHAPNIRAFLDGAVHMTDAITPLARTFPSWVSTLSGKYPQTSGAVMNLLDRDLIREGRSLPTLLKARGYRTHYAIDETRFSNIDASYGFDVTTTPRIGGSDFVLSLVADTPLSNLFINTRLGELMFPHIHANRAAHATYNPDAFVARLRRELRFDAPLFLAAHLTLPHYPHTWATSATSHGKDSLQRGDYFQAVQRADQQLGDILALLQARGALRNALVVLISDHGEALGRPDDLLAADPVAEADENDYQRWGHGTSVFSPSQFHVVLGIRGYGQAAGLLPAPGTRDEPVSLIDIAPTIMALLGQDSRQDFDGQSMLPLLRGEPAASQLAGARIRFTETEFNPPGLGTGEMTVSALAAAARSYRLDPATDRIKVRAQTLERIMNQRQYAAILGKRALAAAVPVGKQVGDFEFVYLPLQGAGVAQDSRLLREALQSQFGVVFRPAAPAMTARAR